MATAPTKRFWAAAELWRTTGDAGYQQYFLAHYAEFLPVRYAPPGRNPGPTSRNLGLWTYVLGGGKNADAVAAIRNAIARRRRTRSSSARRPTATASA